MEDFVLLLEMRLDAVSDQKKSECQEHQGELNQKCRRTRNSQSIQFHVKVLKIRETANFKNSAPHVVEGAREAYVALTSAEHWN